NKNTTLRNMTGVTGAMNGANLAAGPDNVPAVVTNQQGEPQGPAMIKEGEIVFSVESVIGAGNGDYDKGAKILLALHNKLQQSGAEFLQKNSLSGMQEPSFE